MKNPNAASQRAAEILARMGFNREKKTEDAQNTAALDRFWTKPNPMRAGVREFTPPSIGTLSLSTQPGARYFSPLASLSD